MGTYAHVSELKGKTFQPITNNKCLNELGFGFDCEDNRQMHSGWRNVLRKYFNDCFLTIKPSDMDEAMTLVMESATITRKTHGYFESHGLEIQEKLDFVQVATICKIKGWYITGC